MQNPQTKVVNNTGGISFLGLLAIVFITLKLTNYISWSWWLVLLPIYGPLAAFLGLAAGVGALVGAHALYERHTRRKR